MMTMENREFNDDNSNSSSKPPELSDKDVMAICRTWFNINVVRVKELNSYDDRNYNVFVHDNNHHQHNQEFVLKITNSVDSKKPGLLEGQNEMIIHLHNKQFNVPCPIKNVFGDYILRKPLPMSQSQIEYAIRLFTYVPGTILYNVPIDKQLLADCGHYLARIDLALETFQTEHIDNRPEFPWALGNVPNILKYLKFIEQSSRQLLVSKCIERFKEIVESRLDSVKHSFIHGDFNEQNIIVKKKLNSDHYQVHGLIDFGDICYAPRIYDIAIFIAYCMLLDISDQDSPDSILIIPKFVLQGYRRLIALNHEDIQIILICAKARLCQSLTLGAYTYSYQPGNEYLLTTARKGWSILERLCSFNEDELIGQWISE